ncbi:MAG: hypothetical protein ACI31A_09280 [Candidatus Limisoma sp.]
MVSLKSFTNSLKSVASEAYKATAEAAKDASKATAEVAKSSSKFIASVAKDYAEVVVDTAKDATEFVADATQDARKVVGEVAQDASRVAGETAVDARKKFNDVSKNVSETAKKVRQSIAENETLQSVKQSAVDMAQRAGSAISETTLKWKDDFVRFLEIKIKSLLKNLDFQKTISDIEKVGKEKNIDVAPLVKFINQLQNFAENE